VTREPSGCERAIKKTNGAFDRMLSVSNEMDLKTLHPRDERLWNDKRYTGFSSLHFTEIMTSVKAVSRSVYEIIVVISEYSDERVSSELERHIFRPLHGIVVASVIGHLVVNSH